LSSHLRFTPDDYRSLCHAYGTLPPHGSYAAFKRGLADALLPSHPAVAKRVCGLSKHQIRTLRMHLETQRDTKHAYALPAETPARIDLSIREWQAVSQACALLWLDDDCPHSFQGRLVDEVEQAEPALAAKLGQLDKGQAATLYRRVKAGKRWCS
jgi:hypothetical protein